MNFTGMVDIIDNPVDLSTNQGLGHVAAITAIAEDPVTGKLWVAGYTAPRFDPTAALPFTTGDDMFTTPTLAIIPSGTTWSTTTPTQISAEPYIACHSLAQPLSMVFLGGLPADFDDDSDVDGEDLSMFQQCATGAAISYAGGNLPPSCTLTPNAAGFITADFDCDFDVDQKDFASFQRHITGP
jgi:hypothetical protein